MSVRPIARTLIWIACALMALVAAQAPATVQQRASILERFDSWDGFVDRWKSFAANDIRLVDFDNVRDGNKTWFIGVWQPGSGGYWLYRQADWNAFVDKWKEIANQGGRLIGIHSHGNDPGLDVIRGVWPGENPFKIDRHAILKATKDHLGSYGRDLKFNAYSDARSIFRYEMHTLPNELDGPIGTSTLFAAWNAAIYVAPERTASLSRSSSIWAT